MEGPKQRKATTKKREDIDISQETTDVPSPIPSPFVGPLLKGSRRRRQRKEPPAAPEESPYGIKQRKRASSLDASFNASSYGNEDIAQPKLNASSSLQIDKTEKDKEEDVELGVTFQIPPHEIIQSNETYRQSETTPLLHTSARTEEDSLASSDDDSDEAVRGDEEEEDDAYTNFFSTSQSILGTVEETARAALTHVEEALETAYTDFEERRHYDWREFWRGGGTLRFLHWLVTGSPAGAKQTDDEVQENLNGLARLLVLLREYEQQYGMPDSGGPRDQEFVLREVTRDLYAGGCPLWAIQPVLNKVAEGLTGKRGVEFFMLPRRTFIFSASTGMISMFQIQRGYDLRKLDDMEAVTVRLASFASNTSCTLSVPSRWPQQHELRQAFENESLDGEALTQEEMADEILSLASEAEGLFFYINSHHEKAVTKIRGQWAGKDSDEIGDFWKVEDNTRELFSRLACIEAMTSIDKIDAGAKPIYSPLIITLFRVGASSGACAFWFNGSWLDVCVSGVLAVIIAWIGSAPLLSSQERIIFEAVASFIVGLIAALISLTWSESSCFGAMAISGVLDLLQGFRVVYAIIEIMSRHTISGGANFLEGIFFTTLIAYFLRFGLMAAIELVGQPETDNFLQCDKSVSRKWYFVFVPVAALSWSGLFNPYKMDLIPMALHGMLGYLVSLQFTASSTQLNNFLAAMAVTLSAGILSRFSGRQALGNTVSGIYCLLPGAYLVDEVFKNQVQGFLINVVVRAVVIGIGAWTGTVLCSPTMLGTNRGNILTTLSAPALTRRLNLPRTFSDATLGTVDTEVSNASLDTRHYRRQRRQGSPQTGRGSMLVF